MFLKDFKFVFNELNENFNLMCDRDLLHLNYMVLNMLKLNFDLSESKFYLNRKCYKNEIF